MQRWNAGAVFLKDVAKPKTNEPHRAQVQTDLARYMVQGVDAVEKGVSLSDSYNDMGPLQKQLMVGMSKFVLPVSKGANTQARFAESLFFEGGSRHRRGCHVDIPRRRGRGTAAAGYSEGYRTRGADEDRRPLREPVRAPGRSAREPRRRPLAAAAAWIVRERGRVRAAIDAPSGRRLGAGDLDQ